MVWGVGKVTATEIKWSIIIKSVMIIFFVEFIDQLIDYPINCASLNIFTINMWENLFQLFFQRYV